MLLVGNRSGAVTAPYCTDMGHMEHGCEDENAFGFLPRRVAVLGDFMWTSVRLTRWPVPQVRSGSKTATSKKRRTHGVTPWDEEALIRICAVAIKGLSVVCALTSVAKCVK